MQRRPQFRFFTSTGPNDPFPREFTTAPFVNFGDFAEHVGPNHPAVRFSVAFGAFKPSGPSRGNVTREERRRANNR